MKSPSPPLFAYASLLSLLFRSHHPFVISVLSLSLSSSSSLTLPSPMCQLKQKVKFKVPLRTENADLNTLTFSFAHTSSRTMCSEKWEDVRVRKRDVRGFQRALMTLTIVLCAHTQSYKGILTHRHTHT